MAMSLAFHIIFAVVGMAMPLLMVLAERLHLKTGDPLLRELAIRWSRGTAIMFAVGAVSGTVLSFELGLLWPGFMEMAGPIIGMPFSLEGFAFFTEAIFLGIYLYGWDRIPPGAHLFAGILVAISGAVSGIFVVIANAWMNSPTGFELVNGEITNIDPVAAIFNPASFQQALHMTLAPRFRDGRMAADVARVEQTMAAEASSLARQIAPVPQLAANPQLVATMRRFAGGFIPMMIVIGRGIDEQLA